MKNQRLRYANYSIVCQEVPNEISLAINITECPHHCDGCHSDYLSKDIGNYVDDDFHEILSKYKGMITCVCFMGGDQHIDNLNDWLCTIKYQYGLKTCVYSGSDDISIFCDSLRFLDYIKIGHYDKEFGGLDSETTNQKFYKISHNMSNGEYNLEESNYLFWKKYE